MLSDRRRGLRSVRGALRSPARGALALAALAWAAAAPSSAQPFVFYRSIFNAASFAPSGAPHGAVAQGSIFTVFGRGLGPAAGASAQSFPLEQTLAGVSLEVCQAETCAAALPLFVRSDQINAVMPSNAPLGASSLRVTVDGVAGNFSPVTVAAAGFGVFAVNSGGFGPGIVQNFVASADTPLNSAVAAARPGQPLILWGTGLGPVATPDRLPAEAGDLPTAVEISVGGRPVSVLRYSGRAPGFSGLDQIVFDLPADAPSGCYVPVTLRVGDAPSNTVTIAVSPDGSPCADPSNPFDPARSGGATGVVLLTRALWEAPLPVGFSITADIVSGLFQNEPAGPWRFNRLYSLPPPGACTAYAFNEGRPSLRYFAGLARPGAALSAGERLDVDAAAGQGSALAVPALADLYSGFVGTSAALDPALALIFGESAGASVSAPGGADVGAFSVDIAGPPAFSWSNREVAQSLRPGQPLTLEWTGGDPGGLVVIAGFTKSEAQLASSAFVCAARADQGRFTVPALSTAALVRDGQTLIGKLVLAAARPAADPFQAPGLAQGLGLFVAAAQEDVLVP
ncbi:MAG: hypothetical protein GC160_21760 [Acidobacteria bacterium]|nr:hypothetical protein [Acidobacteriota bacterium]